MNDVSVLVSVCGMKHLREHGFLHRDIKPGNILLAQDDDGRYGTQQFHFMGSGWKDFPEIMHQSFVTMAPHPQGRAGDSRVNEQGFDQSFVMTVWEKYQGFALYRLKGP